MELEITKLHPIFLHTFICSLLGILTATMGTEPDISCLKSIKASLEDPYGYLKSSWDFSNYTEGFICSFTGVDCWHADEDRVLNLRLSDMGLRGRFPLGIENCTSLTGLDLSNNELEGPIPSDISKKLPYVTSLDLSFNKISGEIPSSIAGCYHLNVLKLDHNRLTGHIPQELGWLSRIKTFSVSDNQLSGSVPVFLNTRVSADDYANNIGLCGGPLQRCPDNSRKFNWRFDYSFKSGFAIGYAVSLISAVVIYASYCVPWVYMGKKNGMITIPELVKLMLIRKNEKPELDQLGSLSTMEFLLEKEVSTSEHFVTRMSSVDLCNATENFSKHNIIGVGLTGIMYKASLLNGWSLAVKKLYISEQTEEQFISELKTLGRLRHDNLIPLIGFCKEPKTRFLVYKYVSNGNLFDWLHSEGDKKKILKWPLRIRIAAGVAKGLAWLHHCCSFRLAHLNISSKSVLLDKNFEPKLSNFGMSSFINPNEVNSSSRGFIMDVEFWEECFLKEDVFNFGNLLLELITGKMGIALSSCYGSLDEWLRDLSCSSPSVYDSIDEVVKGQGHDHEIFQCLKIACDCVQRFPEKRPTMLDVYMKISNIYS